MGGGGSINYTMIHESSKWLAESVGQTVEYWDCLKVELNKQFERVDPGQDLSPMASKVLQAAEGSGYVVSRDAIENIPNLTIDPPTKQLHLFPNQFNSFGQRTNSGVSIVDWNSKGIELRTRRKVERLEFSPDNSQLKRCVAVHVRNLDNDSTERIEVNSHCGKVIMCAGSATPQLLMPHKDELGNEEIGKHVNDHVLLPLGIYVLDKDIEITGKDVYLPIFATTEWKPERGAPGTPTVCCFDFYCGTFERLWFMLAHLFLAFLFPNFLKRWVMRIPLLFYVATNFIRIVLQIVDVIINVLWGIWDRASGNPWHEKVKLVTSTIKFNAAKTGNYCADSSEIQLDFFGKDENSSFNQDKQVAISEIIRNMDMLDRIGSKPHWLIRWLLRLVTKIPYHPDDVAEYVERYSEKFLLSQQHLSGGCLFGTAIDKGLARTADTGKIRGSANVHVADLSSVPLPRISSQMTAYIIGLHVAKSLNAH